jgi:hypothetical protein
MTPFALLAAAALAQPPDLDGDPVRYSSAPADNPVSRLDARLRRGEVTLPHAGDHGYLPAVLKELGVPVSSQVLVFSKTSLQADRIGPKTPRAIYFSDEVTVGFCRRGDVLELAAADPGLGTAFYLLSQDRDEPPAFVRQSGRCMACHGTSRNKELPGHLLRSVFPDRQGRPVLSAGGFHTDHTSPLAERWGGWYVTGTHGGQAHLGNFVADTRDPRSEGNPGGQNVLSLRDRFTVAAYPSPHSDLVALMVLEHQLEGLNRIARAALVARQAAHYEAALNRDLGEPPGKRWESATRRVAAAAEDLVRYLLFCDEAKLTAPVAGTSGFAEEFAGRGPFDKAGRSLRQLDLSRRLFRFPCSYLVYTRAFAELPAEVKGLVLRRMGEVLDGADQSPAFAHLSAADRQAVREILAETLPGWGDPAPRNPERK